MDTPVSIGVTIALVLAPQPCTHPAAISSSQAGGRLHRLMCPSTASLVPGQRIVQAWRFAAGRPINSLITRIRRRRRIAPGSPGRYRNWRGWDEHTGAFA